MCASPAASPSHDEASAAEARMLAARAEFPLLEQCIYLNNNSTGAMPRGAKRVLDAYWETLASWRDEVWGQWWPDLWGYADEVGALIGAPQGSVLTDTNTATLLGRVMTCFDFRARPRVITSNLEFASAEFLFRAFARYGCEVTVVPSRDGASIDTEGVLAAMDERTQLVFLSHGAFATGALLDPVPIVRRARAVGALVGLDAYQSVGVLPVDVNALGIDFLFGGAHKWLCGSFESAFLYVRPGLLADLRPAATGWIAGADPFTFEPAITYAADARRMSAGTPAVLPALLSRLGLRIVRDIGVDAIRRVSLRRTERIAARAEEAGMTVVTPRAEGRRAGIVCLRFPGDARAVEALRVKGLVCSYRNGVRVGPHFYNTDEEIETFMDALIAERREDGP